MRREEYGAFVAKSGRQRELTKIGSRLWYWWPELILERDLGHVRLSLLIGKWRPTILKITAEPYDDTSNLGTDKYWVPFILDYWKVRISLFGRTILAYRRYANRYQVKHG